MGTSSLNPLPFHTLMSPALKIQALQVKPLCASTTGISTQSHNHGKLWGSSCACSCGQRSGQRQSQPPWSSSPRLAGRLLCSALCNRFAQAGFCQMKPFLKQQGVHRGLYVIQSRLTLLGQAAEVKAFPSPQSLSRLRETFV